MILNGFLFTLGVIAALIVVALALVVLSTIDYGPLGRTLKRIGHGIVSFVLFVFRLWPIIAGCVWLLLGAADAVPAPAANVVGGIFILFGIWFFKTNWIGPTEQEERTLSQRSLRDVLWW